MSCLVNFTWLTASWSWVSLSAILIRVIGLDDNGCTNIRRKGAQYSKYLREWISLFTKLFGHLYAYLHTIWFNFWYDIISFYFNIRVPTIVNASFILFPACTHATSFLKEILNLTVVWLRFVSKKDLKVWIFAYNFIWSKVLYFKLISMMFKQWKGIVKYRI